MVRAKQIRAPGTCRAGDHWNAIQQIECALFQVLTGDVFESLPACEPLVAVHYFYISRNRPYFRVREMPNQARNCFGVHNRIGIDGDNNFTRRFRERVVERRRLSTIWLE